MTIIYRDQSIVVVNKASGISVHNVEDPTNLLDLLKDEIGERVLPVHRLDKETSGVQIFALKSDVASRLAAEFESKKVIKKYVGIVRGDLQPDNGEWHRPLTDRAEGVRNPAGISANRIPCQTNFIVTERNKYFSLCEFDLKSGRQHQIRKHAALAGHALVNDSRYGDRTYNARMTIIYGTERMFLHCAEVSLLENKFVAEVPVEFEKLFHDSK